MDNKIKSYLKLLKEKHEARELIKIADSVVLEAQSGKNIKELKDRLSSTLLTVGEKEKNSDNAFSIAENYLKNFGQKTQGVLTGFRDLDIMTKGLQSPNLIIVAARPSIGKSAFMVNVGDFAARLGNHVFCSSLEMDKEEIGKRMIASAAMVNLSHIIKEELSREELIRIHQNYLYLPQTFEIDDTPAISVAQLRSKLYKYLSKTGKLDLVMVDYIQRMKGKKEQRHHEVEEIANDLKTLAKEFKVPVLALSQLSRAVENRPNKRPQLSDLKESSGVEEAADIVGFLYRDEYYEATTQNKGLAELNIAKGRNIGTGVIDLAFFGQYSKFMNLYQAS